MLGVPLKSSNDGGFGRVREQEGARMIVYWGVPLKILMMALGRLH